jgi:hypothetical protein
LEVSSAAHKGQYRKYLSHELLLLKAIMRSCVAEGAPPFNTSLIALCNLGLYATEKYGCIVWFSASVARAMPDLFGTQKSTHSALMGIYIEAVSV